MGMGKTIQTIALLLSKISTKKHERKQGQGGSLIVAPLAAVLQVILYFFSLTV
jgi:SNF2 family DNA or RNA helicase